MDKFLENYVIKLTQKDLESLDSSITIKKFNLLPNTFLQTEFQVQMAYQTHRKKIMPIYHKIFEKTEEKEGMLTTHFLEARITLIRKPNKRITRKENQTNIFHEHEPEHIFHRATSFMIPSKILAG